jgi:hypothetical protein
MPHPYPLVSVFTEGMRRDIDRAQLPGGSVWNLVDFIPDELSAAASGRGGWTYAGNSLAGATRIQSLSYAPFTAGGKVLAIDQQPKLWDVAAATSISGTPTIPAGPPAYHRGKLIIPNNDGVTPVTYYDGTTLGALPNVASNVTAVLTEGATPFADGDTCTVNNVTYRIKTTMGAANDVQRGATGDLTLDALVKAVNQTGVSGTDYFAGTAAPANVTAAARSGTGATATVTFTGTGGVAYPSTTTGAHSTFAATSFVIVSPPPPAKLAATYKDHAILANTAANPNRLWFSAAGDPTTWDTNFGWWDTTGDVVAVGTLLNAILIFHQDSVERLRGTTPPPGSDMTLEPFLGYGCLDPYSVVSWRNRLVFCSSGGIYMTDGATDVDLTANAQMKTYWQSLMAGYSSSWRISAGVYRDHYIVSVNNGSTLVDCLCVNLASQSMWRLTNLHGSAFVNVTSSLQEECYMGLWNAGRVAKLSSLWSPSASVKTDGDGTVPAPVIETGAFRGYDRLHRRWIQSMGKQKWRFLYIDYDLRDAATDNPVVTLSYATTPTGAYTNVSGGVLPETTDFDRKRRSLNPTIGGAARSNMLCLKAAVMGPYATAKLYTLEVDYSPIGVGQL